jgi:FkbM family methyltransferase
MKKIIYKTLINIISNLIIILNKTIIFFFSKHDFLPKISDKIEKYKYCSKLINKKIINFFIPTDITHTRVQSIFLKEPETINWIDNFKDGSIFWDIGANVGIYSIYAASKFKNLKIISFEPSTSNTRVLSRNISINNLDNKIKIFTISLCEKENIFSNFSESKFCEGWSGSTYDNNTDFEGKKLIKRNIKNNYKILGTSIHQLLEQKILQIPNYIKIDVDGIEHLILKGAKNFLKHKKITQILVEMNPRYKSQFNLINKILKKSGFKKIISTNRKILNNPNYILRDHDTLNTIFKKN